MKKNISLSMILLVFLLWQIPAPAASLDITRAEDVGMSSGRLGILRKRLQQEIDEEVTGGIQVLIARHGKVVMYENLGYANVEDRKPITEKTLFRIFSMTKPVVGVAMMMLYEEGRYSLSDPLSMYIPEFADLQVYAGVDENGGTLLADTNREATILDLMQHTAGFTYGIFGDTPVDRLYREKEIGRYDDTLQDLIDKLADTPLLYQPGERFVYSYAVDIQGYLIEKWTGKRLGDFLQDRIFDPLNMDQTMAWAPPDKAPLLANVYTHDNGELKKFDGPFASIHFRAPGGFSGGGQLISTADDYWRFAQMLLNGGEFEGRRYLSPKTLEMMSTDRLGNREGMFFAGAGFGLNFAVITKPAEVSYPASHGEFFWGGLATTLFWIDPEEDLVVVMLTQYLPWNEPYFRDLMHRMVHAAIIE